MRRRQDRLAWFYPVAMAGIQYHLSRRAGQPPAQGWCMIAAFSSSNFRKPHAAALSTADPRSRHPAKLGGEPHLCSQNRPGARKILLPVDVPLPLRAAAHGARAQLHHRRRHRPLPADARQKRAATDGLGRLRHARRKRGDEPPGCPRHLDLQQYRLHEKPAESAGLCHRLVARNRDLQTRLLPLGTMALHPPL